MPLGSWFRFVRFSHTLFALPFAAVGFVLSLYEQPFTWSQFSLILLCMITNRNAAMAFNRLIDARWDAQNPRTARREIPSGIISPRAALYFVVINSVLFVGCSWMLNTVVLLLSPVALFVVFFYSYTKRFTWLCHYFLGLGLALAPIGAFLAVTAHFSLTTLLLGGGVMCWVAGFDIIYALQDEHFDKQHHLYSIPSRFGVRSSIALSRYTHCVSLLCFAIALYFFPNKSYLAYGALLLFAAILVYQHKKLATNIQTIDGKFMLLNGLNSLFFGALLVLILRWSLP